MSRTFLHTVDSFPFRTVGQPLAPTDFDFRSRLRHPGLGIRVVQDILGELGDVDGGHHGEPQGR